MNDLIHLLVHVWLFVFESNFKIASHCDLKNIVHLLWILIFRFQFSILSKNIDLSRCKNWISFYFIAVVEERNTNILLFQSQCNLFFAGLDHRWIQILIKTTDLICVCKCMDSISDELCWCFDQTREQLLLFAFEGSRRSVYCQKELLVLQQQHQCYQKRMAYIYVQRKTKMAPKAFFVFFYLDFTLNRLWRVSRYVACQRIQAATSDVQLIPPQQEAPSSSCWLN